MLLGSRFCSFLWLAVRRDAVEPTSQVGVDSLSTSGVQYSSINAWIYEVMQDAYFLVEANARTGYPQRQCQSGRLF